LWQFPHEHQATPLLRVGLRNKHIEFIACVLVRFDDDYCLAESRGKIGRPVFLGEQLARPERK
jgi:hypothetical protein